MLGKDACLLNRALICEYGMWRLRRSGLSMRQQEHMRSMAREYRSWSVDSREEVDWK